MLGWIGLLEVATKLNSTCSLGNLNIFSLTLLIGGGQRSPLSLLTRPKKGGSGSLTKLSFRSHSRTSGGMKYPPLPPLRRISFGTNLRHRKRQPSSCQSSIRRSCLTSGAIKSRQRLTKFVPIAVLNRWNWWSTCSTVVPLLNMDGNTPPTSFGNSSPTERIFGPWKSLHYKSLYDLFDKNVTKFC